MGEHRRKEVSAAEKEAWERTKASQFSKEKRAGMHRGKRIVLKSWATMELTNPDYYVGKNKELRRKDRAI